MAWTRDLENFTIIRIPRSYPIGNSLPDGRIITSKLWKETLDIHLQIYGSDPVFLQAIVDESGEIIDTDRLIIPDNLHWGILGVIVDMKDEEEIVVDIRKRYSLLLRDLIWRQGYRAALHANYNFFYQNNDLLTHTVRPDAVVPEYIESDDCNPTIGINSIEILFFELCKPKKWRQTSVFKNLQPGNGKYRSSN